MLASSSNRLLILILAAVILVGTTAAFALEWTAKPGAAVFAGLATTALGVLCPSPLKSGAAPQTDAEDGKSQ